MLAAPALAGLAPALRASGEDDPVIAAAADAIDVFDFERLAHAKLPPAHWGYLKTGVDGDATLLANDAGFANYSLRMRRLVDISRIDTSVTLFGKTWPSPIFLDPVGSQLISPVAASTLIPCGARPSRKPSTMPSGSCASA